ncbi:hypothetical protein C6I20_01980 [Aeromicrobium sp. A1-2]|nr:hypothetical protein C6I20_01980 [Aeromicrobium sp. A1-2]
MTIAAAEASTTTTPGTAARVARRTSSETVNQKRSACPCRRVTPHAAPSPPTRKAPTAARTTEVDTSPDAEAAEAMTAMTPYAPAVVAV